jgi:hypothetical protein
MIDMIAERFGNFMLPLRSLLKNIKILLQF